MAGARGRCRDSPIFTQPLSVISRLETFRSLWEMEQLEVRDCKEKPVPSFHAWPPYAAGAPTLMGTKPPPGAAPDDATCSQDVGGVPRHPFVPPSSILPLPPVDDVVLMEVLQALEHLQDDALHLGTEDRSCDLCGSSTGWTNPRRANPLRCHPTVPPPLCPPRGFWVSIFSQLCFPDSLLQPQSQPGKSLGGSLRVSKSGSIRIPGIPQLKV